MSDSLSPRPRRPGLGVNLLLALVSLLFACLAIEVGLRILRPPPTFKPIVPTTVSQFDPLLGWSLAPNVDVVSQHPDLPIRYRINAAGQREDREYPLERQPGMARVIVLGDSRTFGFGVPAEARYSEVLEQRLDDTEVINMGVSAYGIDQELLRLQKEGLAYNPDLVIAYVPHFGSSRHMYAERFGRSKPLYVLGDDGSLTLTNVPVPDPGPGNLHEWLRTKSRAYNFFALRIGWLLGHQEPPPTELGDDTAEETTFSDAEINEVAGALLLEMDRVTKEGGARLVLISGVPWLHQFALDHDILSLDVAGLIDDRKYWITEEDTHPNEAGNAILADRLYRFLREDSLLPASSFGKE